MVRHVLLSESIVNNWGLGSNLVNFSETVTTRVQILPDKCFAPTSCAFRTTYWAIGSKINPTLLNDVPNLFHIQ